METNDRLTPEPPDTEEDSAIRRCILTGDSSPRAGLIRLALGPGGLVAADLGEKLPGRGAWIAADRTLLDSVAARGKLRGALARAFRSNALVVPDDIAARIEAGLAQRTMSRLGLENRAGNLIFGSDRVREALAKGKVWLLLHAADARPDGADRLDGMARAVGESLDRTIAQVRLPVDRAALSAALGRENVVHAAVLDGRAASRVMADVQRWAGFVTTEQKFEGDEAATTVAANARERH